MSATKALVAYHHATYGGVYYSADIDFTNSAVQPTWTRYATTGLANTLVKVMQVDPVDPYNKVYIQLDNSDVYIWNGASWTKIMDLATARTLTSFPLGVMGYISQDKTIAGHIYIPIGQGETGIEPKMLKSVDYGASWAVMSVSFGGGIANNQEDKVSVSNGKLWYGSSNIYESLFFYDGTWRGDFSIWPNSSGAPMANIDPLDNTACYYTEGAGDADLVKYYWDGAAYAETVLQEGSTLGNCYNGNSLSPGAGCHWLSQLTSGKQRILRQEGSDFKMYQTADGWANLLEASPTNWGATVSIIAAGGECAAQAAALENETYVLMGLGSTGDANESRVYAWAATNNTGTSLPWQVAGTNHATGPYTDAIPSAADAYTAVYGVYVGESPASKGIYVYADEQGDITDIPDYDGLGTPLFGDRSSWRDRVGDGFNPYHAQDVEQDEHELHTPEPTGVLKQTIVEGASGYWEVSGEAVAYESQLHDPVTLDADAAAILDLQGGGGQEIGLDVQTANYVLAGPASGAANEPTFRALVALDLATGGDATKYLRGDMTWAVFANAVFDYIHEHAINEDHSAENDGSQVNYILANEFYPETTAVYLNGVRQLIGTDYTEDVSLDAITFITAPEVGDTLIIDYVLAGAI